MSAPVWLIAEREFRTYVATASFWVALAVGPLAMGGALALTGSGRAPVPIAVNATEPALARSAAAALNEAGRIEGRSYVLARAGIQANLVLVRAVDGMVEARFSSGFPLTPEGRALVARTVERDEALRLLAATGDGPRPAAVRERIEAPSPSGADAGRLSRFALVMILWLTLTGSLGMLLQAVVRERANRALEGLLAAARPWEIVAGKLAGVGAVSVLVLAVWLGSAAGLAVLGSASAGLVQGVFAGLVAPAMLARAGLIYVLAYIFYGLVTIAIGAGASDVAAAQNLSRPVFAVLLMAFFVSLTAVSGAATGLGWFLYVPPFTPFVLLLSTPDELSIMSQLGALGLMLIATAAASRLAIVRLTLSGVMEAVGRPHHNA